MVMAAQDQALKTKNINSKFDKQSISSLYRLCREGQETITHVVSKCKMFARKQYRLRRHDNADAVID